MKLNTVSKAKRIKNRSLLTACSNNIENGKILFKNSDSIIYLSGDFFFVKRLVSRGKKSYLLLLKEEQKTIVSNCEFCLQKSDKKSVDSQKGKIFFSK